MFPIREKLDKNVTSWLVRCSTDKEKNTGCRNKAVKAYQLEQRHSSILKVSEGALRAKPKKISFDPQLKR